MYVRWDFVRLSFLTSWDLNIPQMRGCIWHPRIYLLVPLQGHNPLATLRLMVDVLNQTQSIQLSLMEERRLMGKSRYHDDYECYESIRSRPLSTGLGPNRLFRSLSCCSLLTGCRLQTYLKANLRQTTTLTPYVVCADHNILNHQCFSKTPPKQNL